MTYVHRCMIVPAALAPTCRALTEAQAGPPGAGMFVIGLSASGLPPATHYISTGAVAEDQAEKLDSPQALHEALEGAMALAECTSLLAACDITADDPFDAMARLGLQLIAEAE